MKHIKIEITGTTPLLLHAFTDAAQMEATKAGQQVNTGDRGTPRAQAEQCLCLAPDGVTPIIPQPNLLRALIDAGKFFKNGTSKITTRDNSVVPAAVEIPEVYLPIQHKEPWQVDTRPIRIPATGGRVLRHRPCFHDWGLAFTANLRTEIISEKLFREIVDSAGTRIGLGDFRPDRKGPFGKFNVTKWRASDPASRARNAA